jgi:phospholipase A1/A2
MIAIQIFLILFSQLGDAQAEAVDAYTNKYFKKRLQEEYKASQMHYLFSAHKPFYILPFSYNSSPSKGSLSKLSKVDYMEVKFQFSFKVHAIDSFYHDLLQLSFGYTNISFWQLYNKENSSPFRETNHEPEGFLTFYPQGVSSANSNHYYRIGFNHQSNGQDVPASRSWNRAYVQGIFNLGYTMLSLKVWHRFKESPKSSPLETQGDDNPDIVDYMGNFELQFVSKFYKNTLSTIIRNNLRKENRGALEVSWSFPVNGPYKGYLQYFNGYGENLADYNHSTQRIGIGILMGDWL